MLQMIKKYKIIHKNTLSYKNVAVCPEVIQPRQILFFKIAIKLQVLLKHFCKKSLFPHKTLKSGRMQTLSV